MKFYALLAICLVLCLMTESLEAKKNRKEKKMRGMKKRNKMSKVSGRDDQPRIRLQSLVDRLPSSDIIPIRNETSPIEVKFGLSLQNLIQLDGTQMKAVIWPRFTWKNEFLQWDPKDYGGIRSIRVPIQKMWSPDITLYHSLGKPEMLFDALAVLYSDGKVDWIPAMKITSSCKKPKGSNDRCKVTCLLKYGSWTYSGLQLNLTSNADKIDLSTYAENEDWEIIDSSQERHVVQYECCPEPYIDVTGSLTFLEREDDSDN